MNRMKMYCVQEGGAAQEWLAGSNYFHEVGGTLDFWIISCHSCAIMWAQALCLAAACCSKDSAWLS